MLQCALQCMCYPTLFAQRLPQSSRCTGVGENQGQIPVGFAFSTSQLSELTQQLFVVPLLGQLCCLLDKI